jgi:hypothetical protein
MSTKIVFRNGLGIPLRWNITDPTGKKNLASGSVAGDLATATVDGQQAYQAHLWPADQKSAMSSKDFSSDTMITLSLETKPLGQQQ